MAVSVVFPPVARPELVIVSLSAENGVATFSGDTATTAFVVTAATGVATFGGSTANVTFVVTAASGLGTFGGGDVTFNEVVTATTGVATFGGDTATFFTTGLPRYKRGFQNFTQEAIHRASRW